MLSHHHLARAEKRNSGTTLPTTCGTLFTTSFPVLCRTSTQKPKIHSQVKLDVVGCEVRGGAGLKGKTSDQCSSGAPPAGGAVEDHCSEADSVVVSSGGCCAE